jgi:CRISPR-associated protein Cas2
MLRVIAYDIADPKRLRRVANACLDFGVRVQKSVFECWLDQERFEELWRRLEVELDMEQDFIVSYELDEKADRRRRAHGRRTFSDKRDAYIF